MLNDIYFSTIKFGSNSGKDLVKNHKILLGRLIYETYKKVGKNLLDPKKQQLLMSLADILIEIYATESSLLRAEKTGKKEQIELANYYQYESNQKVSQLAHEISDQLEGGKLLNMVINNLTKMSPFKPYNLENIIS